MGIEEVELLSMGIQNALKGSTPVKNPLLQCQKQLNELLVEFDKKKQAVLDKFMTTDTEGNRIPKKGVENPRLITDYQSTDEEKMMKQVTDLTDKKHKILFYTVPNTRPVIVKTVDGVKEYPLGDYIENSESVPASTVALLNEFFIHD